MTAPFERADLLLFNVSNYPRVPIFPYAFVQVSEVARRFGLRVEVHDFLGTPLARLASEALRLIALHRPRMVGIHLRQLDSLFVDEYRGYRPLDASQPPFFPVAVAEALIRILRESTDLPIVIGGHGFTSNPASVFDRLRPDFGILGEPEDLFAHFDDVLERKNLDAVANLVHFRGAERIENRRQNFGPSPRAEWGDDQIDQLKRFYGAASLHAQSIPVEVMRGCPYHCAFCCEPAVKGRKAHVRDLDAVMEDVAFLGANGLHRIWFVCSEINVFGPDLALELGERITKLREKTNRVTRWHAFSLPARMSEATWRTLAQAGFRGGFNTFMSLDDENLKRGRIPHRAIDAIREYKILETIADELGPEGTDLRARGTLALFFGNSFADLETIHRSLRLAHEHGILETAKVPVVMSATRIFETLDADLGRDANDRVSFDERGKAGLDLTNPTFEYSRALLDHFGDSRSIEQFFGWLESTVLSKNHRATKDWALFLANNTDVNRLLGWCRERALAAREAVDESNSSSVRASVDALFSDLTERSVRALFFPEHYARKEMNQVAEAVLVALFDHFASVCARVFAALGLDGSSASPWNRPIYETLEALYAQYQGIDGALIDVATKLGVSDDSIEIFFAKYYFYARNIELNPSYALPLFGDGTKREPRKRPLALVMAG